MPARPATARFPARPVSAATNRTFRFHTAVITHPDIDHYLGFATIFSAPNFGLRIPSNQQRPQWSPTSLASSKSWPVCMPMTAFHFSAIWPLTGPTSSDCSGQGSIPGDASSEGDAERAGEPGPSAITPCCPPRIADDGGRPARGCRFRAGRRARYQIEGAESVVEQRRRGTPRRRRIGSYSETKNGHSVALRLHFKRFKLLIAGDFNDKAERFLLNHCAGRKRFPAAGSPARVDMIARRPGISAPTVMKVCHHGSNKGHRRIHRKRCSGRFPSSPPATREGTCIRARISTGAPGQARARQFAGHPVERNCSLDPERGGDPRPMVRRDDAGRYPAERAADRKALRDPIIDDIWTLGRSNVSGTIPRNEKEDSMAPSI